MNLVLVGSLLLAATVFDDCGDINKRPPPPPPTNVITPDPSMLPMCPQDPPYGCWGVCLEIDKPGFSDQCIDGPGAGPLTVEFELDVEDKVKQSLAAGIEVCAPGSLFNNITPCDLGMMPVVDMTEACNPAPAGCHL